METTIALDLYTEIKKFCRVITSYRTLTVAEHFANYFLFIVLFHFIGWMLVN